MADVVLLFTGQGAQRVGMGKDLLAGSDLAKSRFAQADEILGRSLSSILFEGPEEELIKTANCQPALFVHGLVLLELLKDAVSSLNPVATAGLSLGELTAHTAGGSMEFEDGLRLVAQRGAFMDEACAATDGAMAAMIGGDEEAVRALAEECGVDVANYNAPGQIVLSGKSEGIDQAVATCKEKGIRIGKKLKVAGAYHSRLMADAQEKLGSALVETTIISPSIPVVSNFSASIARSPEDIRETLEKQVTGSVRWIESMQLLLEQGHRRFVELGPGKVLAGLMGRIDKEAEVLAVEDAESLEVAIKALS